MDFRFTPEEEAFRGELRAFLREELPEGWAGPVDEEDDANWQLNLRMRRKLAARGWLATAWPREYGGQAASPLKQLILAEEMAYHRAPGIDPFAIQMLAPTLMAHGTEDQRRRFLPSIARGQVQWCQGYSEPGSGSDLASLQTRAVEDGDGFIVNGTKVWTSMAHRADHIMLLARTDPDAPKHRGISFLLVDMRTPGVTVSPIVNMAGMPGFNMVTFDNVRVPRSNLVGEKDRGWYVGAALLDFERASIAYSADCRRTLDEMVAFARDAPRNGGVLAEDALVRSRLASLAVEAEACRLLCYRAVWMQSRGMSSTREAAMVKVFGTELHQRMASIAMWMLGLYGQLEPGSKHAALHGRIERSYLWMASTTLAAGTSEVQRSVIATRGLGLPRG